MLLLLFAVDDDGDGDGADDVVMNKDSETTYAKSACEQCSV